MLLLIAIAAASACGGPDLEKFRHLKDPAIREIPRARVLSIELKGDPNETAGKAFGALYKAYYHLRGDHPSWKQETPLPMARWPLPFETPVAEMVGIFALSAPDSLAAAPRAAEGGLQLAITEWAYGPTGEILHVGPYENEKPTIERLRVFAQSKGYRLMSGAHEEVYVKGPGMFFKGDPAGYHTVLRYRLVKE